MEIGKKDIIKIICIAAALILLPFLLNRCFGLVWGQIRIWESMNFGQFYATVLLKSVLYAIVAAALVLIYHVFSHIKQRKTVLFAALAANILIILANSLARMDISWLIVFLYYPSLDYFLAMCFGVYFVLMMGMLRNLVRDRRLQPQEKPETFPGRR